MQSLKISRKMFSLMAVFAMMFSLAYLGCNNGGEDEFAAADTDVALNPETAPAVQDTTFTFANGADLGVAGQQVDLTFGATSGNTTDFTLDAPNVLGTDGSPASATGTTTFGSCTFAVTTSTFPAGTGPQVGETITVNPCQVNVATQGVEATGQATTVQILLVLGLTPSAAQQAQVSIADDGTVTVNDVNTGQTVTLEPTGTAGGA